MMRRGNFWLQGTGALNCGPKARHWQGLREFLEFKAGIKTPQIEALN